MKFRRHFKLPPPPFQITPPPHIYFQIMLLPQVFCLDSRLEIEIVAFLYKNL